jgi:4-O-beta-D-mannosyl-D-glucose phosphorylase
MTEFKKRLNQLYNNYEQLITKPNKIQDTGNGIFDRYQFPVLTAAHAPVFWRYDLNPHTNPYLMERFGINAVFKIGRAHV